MTNIINYPPRIEAKIDAFVLEEGDVVKINVPYTLNKAITLDSFNSVAITIKSATTSVTKWIGITNECKMYSNIYHSYYAAFTIPKSEFTPTAGNYYKVQIAFKNSTHQSNWSTVGVVKCTSAATLSINSLISAIDNINPDVFVGLYENFEATEKIYSYNFTIYDEKNEIFETSNDIIHNGANDEIIVGIGVRSSLEWRPYKELEVYKRYKITLSVVTVNGYRKTTAPYTIKSVSTINANIPAKLLATPDYDNGCVHLTLIKSNKYEEEKPFSGSFIISRYSENLNTWDEVCRFNMLMQTPSQMGTLWTDFTVEHGVKYLYSLQAYNSNNLYSNRLYHVLANPDEYSNTPYLEYDEYGKPYYITGDFEDLFLTDDTRQLKIKFNPKVSTYKPTILENKVDTLGGKYPFIFRNGNVNYKEFAISGLLSYLMDDKEYFMAGIQPITNNAHRSHTQAINDIQGKNDWDNAPTIGTKLTSENFFLERQFKAEVLEWLTNGQPKLFRSAGEGNYIIRLMNVSLSPNETLGRMLHTFSATAYEIAEHNFLNLKKYNLLKLPEENNAVMRFVEKNIGDNSVNGVFSPGHNMYHVSIFNAPAYTRYSLRFNELIENSSVTYDIGLTGALHLDSTTYPITSIKTEYGDNNHNAIIRYGYYDTLIPDNFNYITKVNVKDEMMQIIGQDYSIDVIATHIRDRRRQTDRFYQLLIKPKNIEYIYTENNGISYKNYKTHKLIETWIPTTIYVVLASANSSTVKYYIDGNKPLATSAHPFGTKFKLNNGFEVDLSSVYNLEPENGFIVYTKGYYEINCDMGKIQSLHLDQGVYAEMSYELKELEYSIESSNATVINAKKAWQDAKAAVLALAVPGTSAAARDNAVQTVKNTYTLYLLALENALEAAGFEEDDYYVI